MRLVRGAGLLLLLGGSAQTWCQATATGLSLEAETQRVSAFLDGQLADDEKAAVAHRGAAAHTLARWLVRASAPLPWTDGAWRFGAFADSQAWVMGDSVRALAFLNNKEVGSQNASHGFNVQSQFMRRTGLTLSTTWEAAILQSHNLHVTTQLKYYAVNEFKASHVRGALTETVAGAIGLQAQTVEQNLGGQTLFVKPDRTLGHGFALDASVKLINAEGSFLAIAVEDLGPAVTLPSVLRTSQSANTNTVSFDANGYIHFAPLLSGQYASEQIRVVFAPTWSAALAWRLNSRWDWLASAESTQTVHQVSSGLRLSSNGQQFTGLIHVGKDLPGSLEVAWRSKWTTLAIRADALSPQFARIWGMKATVLF